MNWAVCRPVRNDEAPRNSGISPPARRGLRSRPVCCRPTREDSPFKGPFAEDLTRNERLCWGSPAQVRDALIGLGDALGSNVLLLQFNQGAMPHEMFVHQIRRFAEEVLPDVRRHTVTNVAVV